MKLNWPGTALLTALLVVSGCSDHSNQPLSASREQLVIEPHVRVGKVWAGMSTAQIIAQLGEPERRTTKALEYTRLGFAVLPDSNNVVSMVMCGDVMGVRGPFVKAFNGRTKEGIGMLSTREELLKAYGEATEDKKFRAGLESMNYRQLGISFTLEDGKVHHIIVSLDSTSEPDRTITLEPSK